MRETYTPIALKHLYDAPLLGRQGDIGEKERDLLASTRDGFIVEHPKTHPTQDSAIQATEEALEHMAKIHTPPVGWFKTSFSQNADAPYGSFYGNFPDFEKPDTIHIGSDPKNTIRANFSDTSVKIEQGDLFTPLRWSGMYFLHTRTSTVSQALNFQGPAQAQIHDFFHDPSVLTHLFPTYIPYHERPDTQKTTGELNLMISDIRTTLPDGTRGLLRAGFVVELAYKYLAAKQTYGNKKIDGVVSILRGDGDMDGYYVLFKKHQNALSKAFPDYTTDKINALAAEKTLTTYARLGFTEKRVVEFPERNIVVVSSLPLET